LQEAHSTSDTLGDWTNAYGTDAMTRERGWKEVFKDGYRAGLVYDNFDPTGWLLAAGLFTIAIAAVVRN